MQSQKKSFLLLLIWHVNQFSDLLICVRLSQNLVLLRNKLDKLRAGITRGKEEKFIHKE